jgi:hypothetical protein
MVMNDKQLADAVVAIGVGRHQHFSDGRDKGDWYGYDSTGDSADVFVRDWRVAGALMEKVQHMSFERAHGTGFEVNAESYDLVYGNVEIKESLPRAIIEACVMALRKDGE